MSEIIDLREDSYVKVDVIARLFGVTVRRIQQLTQDGILKTEKINTSRRYNLFQTVQSYTQYLSGKSNNKVRAETEAELKEQKLRAEVALKESQGELHRLRTEIAAGRYIPVEEVKLDYSRFFVVLKKFVMGIPAKMSGRIAGSADPVEVRQIEKDLQKEATKILKNFVISAAPMEPENKDGKETLS